MYNFFYKGRLFRHHRKATSGTRCCQSQLKWYFVIALVTSPSSDLLVGPSVPRSSFPDKKNWDIVIQMETPDSEVEQRASTDTTTLALLHVMDISKDYPGIRALDRVELRIAAGTVHALIGENGAGKSTLIKCLAGVVKPDHLELTIQGSKQTIGSAADAEKLGLAFIHQELNLVDYFTAGENVFLGHRLPTRLGLYDRKKLAQQTSAIFQQLQVDVPLDEPVRYLAPAQRAMVAIARAFARDASVYFMDEPATALTPAEKSHLFAMIRRLVAQGRSVVYVSHNLDDVLQISDHVTVLRDGKNAGSWPTKTIEKRTILSAMIGQEPDSLQSSIEKPSARRSRDTETTRYAMAKDAIPGVLVLLKVEELTGAGVGPLSFSLYPGEILGIGGLVGSGRSTALKLIAGALPAAHGAVHIHGLAGKKPTIPRSPAQALRAGIVLIPEERRSEGLALHRSVMENAIISGLSYFSTHGLIDFSAARSAVHAAGAQVTLRTASASAPVQTLSGGNQQKVLFARAVLAQPRVLLLDEPTKGVDVGARAEIYQVIRDLASQGMGIILVSSDFEEILTLSDRIQFLRNSRMGRLVENTGLTQQDYLQLAYQGATGE